MPWVIKVEEVIDGAVVNTREVASIERSAGLHDLDELGLSITEAKAMLAQIQTVIVTRQVDLDANERRTCTRCSHRRHIKDHRQRSIDTLFGTVVVRAPRLRCGDCDSTSTLLAGRSTPALELMHAKLAARVSFRGAQEIMFDLLPVSGGSTHSTIRRHAVDLGERLVDVRRDAPTSTDASRINLCLDTAYVRATKSHPSGWLHVTTGQVGADTSQRRQFATLDIGPTQHVVDEVRIELNRAGLRPGTRVCVLSDGEGRLRNVARDASGVDVLPILDWFHIAMRLQPAKQAALSLSTRMPSHAVATARIRDELDRLHWRLWHGRTNAVSTTFERLRKYLKAYRRYVRGREASEAPRRVVSLLYSLDRYVRSQSSRIVNYAKRQRRGEWVGTSLAESSVNALVNKRMNKRQQMRWSAAGAHGILQLRAAVLNGEFDALANQAHRAKRGCQSGVAQTRAAA